MKKTVRILALSLVFVMLALVLVACGNKPNSDFSKAKKNLEKEDYKVELLTDGVTIGLTETALGIENVEAILKAEKKIGSKYEYVSVIYFKDAESAKNAMKKIEAEADDEMDEDDDMNSAYVKTTLSGKMIYAGTKNGLKAAS